MATERISSVRISSTFWPSTSASAVRATRCRRAGRASRVSRSDSCGYHRFRSSFSRRLSSSSYHALGYHVRSAGSTPAEEINPAVVDAMQELGVDMSEEFPKPLTDDVVRDADAVITMGCGDACPIYPGKRYLDWDLPDPAGKTVELVRPIRDEIDRRVTALLEELVPARS